jgi:hypothetical protein
MISSCFLKYKILTMVQKQSENTMLRIQTQHKNSTLKQRKLGGELPNNTVYSLIFIFIV